jgi:hypothetical protein
MEGVLEGLAQAAQILSSGDASAVDRAGAEAAFDQLKTGEYPLEAFGVVLEAAAHPDAPDDNLLFHTATVLKVRTDVRACVRACVRATLLLRPYTQLPLLPRLRISHPAVKHHMKAQSVTPS